VETPAAQWAYAVEILLSRFYDIKAIRIKLQASVNCGRLGIGEAKYRQRSGKTRENRISTSARNHRFPACPVTSEGAMRVMLELNLPLSLR
jgi:hypothetical protein